MTVTWVDGSVYASGGIAKNVAPGLLTPATSDPAGVDQLKTYLEGIGSFTFPSLPAGRVKLLLHFCDPSSNAIGQRIFDVFVNGSLYLHNFDIFAEAGLTAKELVKTVVVDHPGGNFAVTFVPTVGLTLLNDAEGRNGTGVTPSTPVVISAPPPPTPTPLPTLSLAAVPGTDQVTVNWTWTGTGATGWIVARDGVDSTGFGAYTSGTLAATTRSVVFDKLLQTTYHFTVTPVGAGSPVTVAAAPLVPVTPPPTSPGSTLSGVFANANDAIGVGGFAATVGHPMQQDHCYIFSRDTGRALFSTVTPWLKADPSRQLLLGIHHITDSNWNAILGTSGLADSSLDHFLWDLCDFIQAQGIASQVCITPEEEFNYTWETFGSAFVSWWNRVIPGCRSRAPGMKIGWTILPDHDYTPFWPTANPPDNVGIDIYDFWVDGTASPQGRWAQSIAKIQPVITYAKGKGVTWSFDEWAVWEYNGNSVPYGGGDNPYYVTQMLATAKSQGAAWQNYFNSPGGSVNTTLQQNPNSLAAYKTGIAAY